MKNSRIRYLTRRTVLGGLAILPVAASRSFAASISQAFVREAPPITAADQVLNVMEFEALARDALPPAHFGYIATGADDDRTVVRNHDAFSHYEIRARRFVDVSHVDAARSVFGATWASPIYLSAVSGQRAFHPDAELGTARAARTRSMQMMLSGVTRRPSSRSAKRAAHPYGSSSIRPMTGPSRRGWCGAPSAPAARPSC